jgi:hypothetical protein
VTNREQMHRVRFSAPTTIRSGSDRASMQRRAKARPTVVTNRERIHRVRFSAPTTIRSGSDRASMQRRAKARPAALGIQPANDRWSAMGAGRLPSEVRFAQVAGSERGSRPGTCRLCFPARAHHTSMRSGFDDVRQP